MNLREVMSEDVEWVCRTLGLPQTAFSGIDGNDPRLKVLCNNSSLDVEACPGSGKTTLLVAKLAILARHWTDQQQGICVLSHTNAARREIEKKLGTTSEGQRLLSYPHFVGTIHGFVNEYLALPWLRSKGVKIEAVDDEICLKRRWARLPYETRKTLEKKRESAQRLRYKNAEFGLGDIPWSKGGTLGDQTRTYKNMRDVCQESYSEGLFCHDEMFVWAGDLLDKNASVVSQIRQRFPLLFVDEVQDNSDAQSKILHRIFSDGDDAVMRQRFGDQNQAIYAYQGQDGASTDTFPNHACRATIPNSFRFGESIASLVDPLAVAPIGLVGRGGKGQSGEDALIDSNAIFLFDDESICQVMDVYVDYLRHQFNQKELATGDFTAVGAVHRKHNDDKLPYSIKHYWPAYEPDISGAEPKPRLLHQYLLAGRRLSDRSGEADEYVEMLAQGVTLLAKKMQPDLDVGTAKFKHRRVLLRLAHKPEMLERYLRLIEEIAVSRMAIEPHAWSNKFRPEFEAVGMALADVERTSEPAKEFLEWSLTASDHEMVGARSNIFEELSHDPPVKVHVGSIHSVKGETHTATLVLETFYKAHHLKMLKRWLLGKRIGGEDQNGTTVQRLRLHYVAMSRAARLLCLAMRADTFCPKEIIQLRQRGWRIACINADGVEWLP